MTCVYHLDLCIPQHDDKRFRFNAIDQSGTALDVSTAQEITFIIATSVNGTTLLTKTLTGGTIQIGINTQFYLDITSAESGGLGVGRKYCEARITNSAGDHQTVGAGPFTVQDTKIGD